MNVLQLKQDVYFLVGATSATYLNADLIRNMNVAYQNVATLIWQSADGWQYNDGVIKSTLTHSTQDYTIPTTSQLINRIEIKDNNGTWRKLQPIDIHDVSIAMPEFEKTPSLPIYYDLHGTTVSFYPAPSSASVTLSSGMALYVNKDVTEFGVSATTTIPAFASSFHRILSYAAAIDFVQDKTERDRLVVLKTNLERNLINLYSRRNVERPSRIKPGGANKGSRQYI